MQPQEIKTCEWKDCRRSGLRMGCSTMWKEGIIFTFIIIIIIRELLPWAGPGLLKETSPTVSVWCNILQLRLPALSASYCTPSRLLSFGLYTFLLPSVSQRKKSFTGSRAFSPWYSRLYNCSLVLFIRHHPDWPIYSSQYFPLKCSQYILSPSA